MEENNSSQKINPWYIFMGVLITFGIGLLLYTSFFGKEKLPKEFLFFYKDTNQLAKNMIISSAFDFLELRKKEEATKSAEALLMVKDALALRDKNIKRLETLEQKSIKLKIFQGKISDLSVKTLFTEFVKLYDERNKRFSRYYAHSLEIFNVLEQYYKKLASGTTQARLPETINTVVQTMQQEFQALVITQQRIDSTYDEILRVANIDEQKETLEGSIQDAFKNPSDPTPTPTPTNTPTPTPIPTPTPTVTLELSPTATPSPTMSDTPTPTP